MARLIPITLVICSALACRTEIGEILLSYGKGHGSPPPEERPPTALDPECSELFESRAVAVRQAFAACETDADCALVDGPGCLGAFLCTSAVTAGSEEEYLSAAEIEVADYIETCGNFCSIADCELPRDLRAFCDTSTGLCEAERFDQ